MPLTGEEHAHEAGRLTVEPRRHGPPAPGPPHTLQFDSSRSPNSGLDSVVTVSRTPVSADFLRGKRIATSVL